MAAHGATALGERAGMHKLSVAKLEHGLCEPSLATVQALADALAVGCEAFRQEPGPAPATRRGRPPKAAPPEPAPKRPRGRPREEVPPSPGDTPEPGRHA